MDWDDKLDAYAADDSFGKTGFAAGGQWNFGVQMEITVLIFPRKSGSPGRGCDYET